MFCEFFEEFSPVLHHCYSVMPLLRDTDSYPLRTVGHYEFEYVFAASEKAHVTIDGIQVPMKADTLYFRRPGMSVQGAGVYNGLYFDFDFNLRCDVIDGLEAMPVLYEFPAPQEAKQLVEAIFDDYYSSSPTRIIKFKIYMGQLFQLMIEDWYYRTKPSILKTTKIEDFRRSITYIQECYASPVTVSELAGQVGYSVFHYTRLFKEYTGFTPVQYINHCRIAQAKKMLTQTGLSIEDILYACGFRNYSYFFRTFKASCDVTPSEYRKRHMGYAPPRAPDGP